MISDCSFKTFYAGSQTGAVTATLTSHLETIASLKEELEGDESFSQQKKIYRYHMSIYHIDLNQKTESEPAVVHNLTTHILRHL